MAEVGILKREDRVELLDGDIVIDEPDREVSTPAPIGGSMYRFRNCFTVRLRFGEPSRSLEQELLRLNRTSRSFTRATTSTNPDIPRRTMCSSSWK